MPHPKIERAIASWTTPYSDATWSTIDQLRSKASIDAEKGELPDWVALGPTLPDDTEARIARLVVHRHREDGKPDAHAPELHWTLTVRRAPRSEPPEILREHNEKLGGRPGLMALLGAAAPQVGSFRVRLRVERPAWQCKVLPVHVERGSELAVAMNLGGRGVWLEQVGYRFESVPSGLAELAIVYLHEEQAFTADIMATGTLKLTSLTWLPYADEISELVLSTFFAAVEGMP